MTIGAVEQAATLDELISWLVEPVDNALTPERINEIYLMMHPRIVWLKNLPKETVLFDLGAGEGGLINFRDWLGFTRKDLVFLGASLGPGKDTGKYEEFFVGDVEVEKPKFLRRPDAVIMAHFIEHIREPRALLEWIVELLPTGGRIYIEWPGPNTLKLPRKQEFNKRGYQITTLNFHDDGTHVTAHAIPDIARMLDELGVSIRTMGMVDMPYLADLMKEVGVSQQNDYLLSMAMWLKTLFASYVVGVKR